MKTLFHISERTPDKDGLYFCLNNCSYLSICLFENGKWYSLNTNPDMSFFGITFKSKIIPQEITKDEIKDPDFYWLLEFDK